MEIAALDPARGSDLDGVVDLHYRLLDTSHVLGLGRRFVRDFYYDVLVREGLLEVVLGRDGEQVVGFISHTRQRDFMTIGLRRHFLRVGWLLLRALLERPARIFDLAAVARLAGERSGRPAGGRVIGEVVTLVAAEEHQKKVPIGGRSRLTVRLFEEATAYFRSAGIDRIYLYVMPDNRASNLFCSAMGCSFEKLVNRGVAVHRFTYTLPTEAGSGAAASP